MAKKEMKRDIRAANLKPKKYWFRARRIDFTSTFLSLARSFNMPNNVLLMIDCPGSLRPHKFLDNYRTFFQFDVDRFVLWNAIKIFSRHHVFRFLFFVEKLKEGKYCQENRNLTHQIVICWWYNSYNDVFASPVKTNEKCPHKLTSFFFPSTTQLNSLSHSKNSFSSRN